MARFSQTIHLTDARATCALAQAIAPRLGPGDTLLLAGDIGAGKTHFARCLIQTLLTVPEDIPSPTFTLVQTYATPVGEVWHADLYRLGHTSEIVELGLAEAFETAITLVEWPDRLGPLAPADALHIELQTDATRNAREAHFSATGGGWQDRLNGVIP